MTVTILRVKGKPERSHGSGHTKPRQPTIDIKGPGRLRVAHVMSLLGISHSTIYARMRAGALPQFDGRDGRIPYWRTETIRQLL